MTYSKTCKSCGVVFYLDLAFDECWCCRNDLFPSAEQPERPPEPSREEAEPKKPEALFNREYPVPWDDLFPLADPADNWKPARDIA